MQQHLKNVLSTVNNAKPNSLNSSSRHWKTPLNVFYSKKKKSKSLIILSGFLVICLFLIIWNLIQFRYLIESEHDKPLKGKLVYLSKPSVSPISHPCSGKGENEIFCLLNLRKKTTIKDGNVIVCPSLVNTSNISALVNVADQQKELLLLFGASVVPFFNTVLGGWCTQVSRTQGRKLLEVVEDQTIHKDVNVEMWENEVKIPDYREKNSESNYGKLSKERGHEELLEYERNRQFLSDMLKGVKHFQEVDIENKDKRPTNRMPFNKGDLRDDVFRVALSDDGVVKVSLSICQRTNINGIVSSFFKGGEESYAASFSDDYNADIEHVLSQVSHLDNNRQNSKKGSNRDLMEEVKSPPHQLQRASLQLFHVPLGSHDTSSEKKDYPNDKCSILVKQVSVATVASRLRKRQQYTNEASHCVSRGAPRNGKSEFDSDNDECLTLAKEAYLLDVAPRISHSILASTQAELSDIVVVTATTVGLMNALRSLMQISLTATMAKSKEQRENKEKENNSHMSLPTLLTPALFMETFDAPKLEWRGQHLDVSRHFFQINVIKSVITELGKLKLNRFHWHLTDDQGWRIESKKFPGAHNVGGMRGPSLNGARSPKYTGSESYFPKPRYYTLQEINEVTHYALLRGITVVPEIDLPAHAGALTTGVPRIGGRVTIPGEGNVDCHLVEAATSLNRKEIFIHMQKNPQQMQLPYNCMGGSFGMMYPTVGAVKMMEGILAEVVGALHISNRHWGEDDGMKMEDDTRRKYFHIGGDQAELIRNNIWARKINDIKKQLENSTRLVLSEDDSLISPFDIMLMDNIVRNVDPIDSITGEVYGIHLGSLQAALEARLAIYLMKNVVPLLPEDTADQNSENGIEKPVLSIGGYNSVVWDETLLLLDQSFIPQMEHTFIMFWRDDKVNPREMHRRVVKAVVDSNKRAIAHSVHNGSVNEDNRSRIPVNLRRLILAPKTLAYFDYIQHDNVFDNKYIPMQQPPPWFKYKAVTLKRTFSLHKMIHDIMGFESHDIYNSHSEDDIHIIHGVQGCLWTELVKTTEMLQYQLFPRIMAVADAGWTERFGKSIISDDDHMREFQSFLGGVDQLLRSSHPHKIF